MLQDTWQCDRPHVGWVGGEDAKSPLRALKGGYIFNDLTGMSEEGDRKVPIPAQLKNPWALRSRPSAAKAGTENRTFTAAVNRCATQKQEPSRVFQQSVKPLLICDCSVRLEPHPFKAKPRSCKAVPYPLRNSRPTTNGHKLALVPRAGFAVGRGCSAERSRRPTSPVEFRCNGSGS